MRKHLKLAIESDTSIAAINEVAAAETGTPDAAAAATTAASVTAASDAAAAQAGDGADKASGAADSEAALRQHDQQALTAGVSEHSPAGDHAVESPLATHGAQGDPATGPSEELGETLEIHPDLLEDDVAESEMEDSLECAQADSDATVVENEQTSAALEALGNTVAQIRELIKTRQCTPATLALATESIQAHLGRVGHELPAISLEADVDIEEHHRQLALATESVMGRMNQETVLGWKHQWNAVADFFRTIDGQVSKYDKKLDAAHHELQGLGSELGQGPFTVNLGGLWYHFSTDKGQVTNVIAAIEADLKTSKYLLVDYPTQVLAVLKHQMSVITSLRNKHDPQALEAAAKDVANGKSPFELFDHNLLAEGYPLLSVVGLRVREGHKPKPLGPGEVYERLAAAEQVRYVYEQGSVKHFGKKVLANVATPLKMVDMATNKNVQFTAADIAKLIELSKQYLTLAEEGRKIERQSYSIYENLCNYYNEDMQHMRDEEGASWVYARSESRLLTAIHETVWNSFLCLWYPASSEIRRAVKAAKYGHYLSLRMMHTAVHGN